MSEFFVIGTSHRYAPVEVRAHVAFADEELPDALDDLCRDLAEEAVILSTCNRTELYVVPKNEGTGPEEVRLWLANYKKMQPNADHFFTLHAGAAAHHLMEVAAGIDSQVIGDIQIIGQVKEAYRAAMEQGRIGKVLTRLFETALHSGKRVKAETELFTGAVSISYVAVELARKIFYPLEDQRTLVVGAGETGELTVASLRGRGVREITVTNRTESRGRELIERLGFGEWLPMNRLSDELHRFDIVIVATGARDYVLGFDDVRRAIERRSGKTMLIVDLSVPRNVDPRVSEIDNLFCKDLNDLNSVIETNVERRREEIPKAEEIINEELDDFLTWQRMLPVTPVIADLRRQAETIAGQMLEENKGRFSEEDFRNVEKLVGSVVKRIIGLPMSHLLEAGRDPEGARRKAEYVKELFNLHGPGKEGSDEEKTKEMNGIGPRQQHSEQPSTEKEKRRAGK